MAVRTRITEHPKMILRCPYETGGGQTRVKIEVNTFESFPANALIRLRFRVEPPGSVATDLLADGAEWGAIYGYQPSFRFHETLGSEHYRATARTGERPRRATHIPMVAVWRRSLRSRHFLPLARR